MDSECKTVGSGGWLGRNLATDMSTHGKAHKLTTATMTGCSVKFTIDHAYDFACQAVRLHLAEASLLLPDYSCAIAAVHAVLVVLASVGNKMYKAWHAHGICGHYIKVNKAAWPAGNPLGLACSMCSSILAGAASAAQL